MTLMKRFRAWTLSGGPVATLVWTVLFLLRSQTGMADTTSTTLSADQVSAYIADKTLLRAEKQTRIKQFGDKATLPRRESKTFQYTRYEYLALPTSTLSEGVTPASTQMSVATVSAVVEQWGQVVVLTDVVELTIKHSALQKGTELLGEAAAQTVDREAQEILLAGTNIQYANAKSSRANLLATDVMSSTEVRKVTANLRNNGARAQDEGDDHLFGVFDPSVEADLSADTTFVNAASYSSIKNLRNMEIGSWLGVRWVRSNFLYTFLGVASSDYAIVDVATGGSIAQTTTVYVVVTGVNSTTGFEERIYQQASVTTATDGLSTHKVTVTAPSTSGYTYNVYAGTTSGTTYQVTTGIAASGTYDITSVPSSGTTNPPIPGTGVTVHVSWVFGKEAFTVIELDGMSLQTYITPKGASDSDPLAQRRKIGWKLMWKALITNNNFFRRVESGSAY